MKKQLLSLALLLGLSASFASSSFATDQRDHHGQEQRHPATASQRSAKLAQELGLTNRQKAKVEKIFQEQQIQALRGRSANRSQSRSEAHRIYESTSEKLQNVLSKKQYAQLQAKRQERHQQLSRQGSRPGPNGRDDSQRGNDRRSRS